ncbi:MAG: hypothetical protein N2509_08845, partial [Treponemataceae bacterium]|nr:hypothetical protein [Treponemataceae bacterium]
LEQAGEQRTGTVALGYLLGRGETWESELHTGYEWFIREDSLYPGFWEGWFGELAFEAALGNDRILSDCGGTLRYRRGILEGQETENTVATLWGTWQKAGGTGGTLHIEISFGVNNLPRFFALGGWKTAWPIAGYPEEVLRGRLAAHARLEVSWPILTFDAPFLSMGVVRDLTGTLFCEGGFAGERFSEMTSLCSMGGELTVHAFVAEEIPLSFTVGYAKPFKAERSGEWYLELGIRFR